MRWQRTVTAAAVTALVVPAAACSGIDLPDLDMPTVTIEVPAGNPFAPGGDQTGKADASGHRGDAIPAATDSGTPTANTSGADRTAPGRVAGGVFGVGTPAPTASDPGAENSSVPPSTMTVTVTATARGTASHGTPLEGLGAQATAPQRTTSYPPTTTAQSTQRADKTTSTATSPATTTTRTATQPTASGRDILAGTSCQIFPDDNVWHADIRALPVDARSDTWLAAIGSGNLHPDFGPSYRAQPVPYGLPITVAPAGTPRVPVTFQYADESDHVGYPLTADTRIEGGPGADGDRHTIIVTADTCELFELFDVRHTADGWVAGSGAHWDLASNALRPAGWTSADAAGLPILPGLLRWSEVTAGAVHHAIRFTAPATAGSYLWPARHEAGSGSAGSRPPMGARFRLAAGFDVSGFSPHAQTILRAMRTYGLILADNGSAWYFQGNADPGWPAALIDELKTIPATAFEAVDTSALQVSADSGLSASG